MNREERIINAGIDYTIANIYPSGISAALRTKVAEFSRNRAFEAGARWADNHQWASCKDDLPEEYGEFVFRTIYKENAILTHNDKGWWNTCVYVYPDRLTEIYTHWMPIPPINEE